MTKYVVRGTVYIDYIVEVEASDKDEARELAEGMPLAEWSDDGGSGIDIYEIYEEDNDE